MQAFEEGDKLLIRSKIIEAHHTPGDFDPKLCLSIIAVTLKNAQASPLPAPTAASGAFMAQVRCCCCAMLCFACVFFAATFPLACDAGSPRKVL